MNSKYDKKEPLLMNAPTSSKLPPLRPLATQITDDHREILETYARMNGCSIAEAVRRAIEKLEKEIEP